MGDDSIIPSKVAVIGAGNVGLLFMRNFLRAGHEVVGFEQRSKIGGMWNFESDNKESGYDKCNPDGSINCSYSATQLNTSKLNILASDDILANHQELPENCQWMSSEQFVKCMNKSAKHFDLVPLIRLNTKVTKVEKSDENIWSVHYLNENGEKAVEKFNFVLCCSGGFRFPKLPAIPKMDAFKGISIHSSQIRFEDKFFAKRKILVLGGSFSGTDVAYYALKNKSEKVYWAVTRGKNSNYWLLDRCPPGSDPSKPFDLGFNRYTWFDKPEIAQNNLTSIATQILTGEQKKADKVTLPEDKFGVSDVPYMKEQWASKKLENISPIKHVTTKGVELVDGRQIEVDVIVYCTGFESRFPALDGVWPIEEQAKNELYYHMIPVNKNMQGIAIAGANEAITSKTSIYELQARWLTEFWLTRKYDAEGLLFSQKEITAMQKAVNERRSSTPSTIKFNMITDIWSLCDCLAKDIGCLPPDYRSLICSDKTGDNQSRQEEVELGVALMYGPMITIQYRIQGNGAFQNAERYYVNVTRNQLGAAHFDECVQQAIKGPKEFLKSAEIDSTSKYCVKPYFTSILTK